MFDHGELKLWKGKLQTIKDYCIYIYIKIKMHIVYFTIIGKISSCSDFG